MSKLVERRGTDPIPPDERAGTPGSVFTLWFSTNIQFSALTTGALVTAGLGLSFSQGALAVSAGTLLGSLIVGVLSIYGPRFGVPQLMLSRGAYGYRGNIPNAVFVALNGIGWFCVHTLLTVSVLQQLWQIPLSVALTITVVVQVTIAVIGYRIIHIVQRVFAAVLLLTFGIISFYGFGDLGHGLLVQSHPGSGAFLIGMGATSARSLGYSMYASDHTRYLPQQTRRMRSFAAGFGGCAVGGLWIGTLGAALGSVARTDDPTTVVANVLPQSLATLALIALICSTSVSTVIDLYSGSMAALATGLRVPRWVSAASVGGLGYVICIVAGRYEFPTLFQGFLQLSGYWIAPWAAILILYLILSARDGSVSASVFYDHTHTGRGGATALVIGIICAIPFMQQDIYTGIIARNVPGLGDIGYIIGFFAAAIAYLAFRRAQRDRHPDSMGNVGVARS